MYNELTEVDIKKMKEEIEHRACVLRPKLNDELAEARALGDLSENDEYRCAKRNFCQNESRIRYLEKMIRTAKIIKADSAPDEVGLFDKVKVKYEDTGEEEEIMLSTTTRLDIQNGVYSKDSPFGKAILGKKVGDRVLVRVSDEIEYYVTIVSIKKGTDDDSLKLNEY